MLPFALSIFSGAFLLFALQPLIGKYILPWFGGGPGVWTTCLLFFQTLLLGGYVYAHVSATKLRPRQQVVLHLVLLAFACCALPITPSSHWKPPGGDDPIGRILLLLLATVGLPYFALSATGPLMQQWFSHTEPTKSPYRLYALSNAGSLLALIGYPFFFERVLSRHEQAAFWSIGLGVFALFCAWCGVRVWRSPSAAAAANSVNKPASDAGDSASSMQMDRVLWFSLAAVGSVLLLATTNKLCQDLAVIPFLWVLPLSLYLLSFILCFDHPRWYSRGLFAGLFALGVFVDAYLLSAGHGARLPQQIIGYTGTLFAACMLCHGELFRLRPATRELTRFYLHIAAGGAFGAFIVAIIGPLVFDRFVELQLGLWLLSYLIAALAFRHRNRALPIGIGIGAFLATLIVPVLKATAKRGGGSFADFAEELKTYYAENWAFIAFFVGAFLLGFLSRKGWLREWQFRTGNFLMMFSFGLGVLLIVEVRKETELAVSTSRNFYGVLKIFEHNPADEDTHYFSLVNGVTSHGMQFTATPQATWPTSYYGENSGVGLALDFFVRDPRHAPRHIGLVGLGVGTVASYGHSGEKVRIYEINPRVEQIARTQFTYLKRSEAEVNVVMGDARLSMERELARHESQQFDVLALDAFSSDAIPVHLLTREAFAVYFQHLKPNGILAVHTSNRYLRLEPVVARLARDAGYEAVEISDEPSDKKWWLFRSTWILVTKNHELLDTEPFASSILAHETNGSKQGLWTDDYSSLFEVLK
jgi:hypothetical protein